MPRHFIAESRKGNIVSGPRCVYYEMNDVKDLLIPLDIFKKKQQNKGISRKKMQAVLMFKVSCRGGGTEEKFEDSHFGKKQRRARYRCGAPRGIRGIGDLSEYGDDGRGGRAGKGCGYRGIQ